MNEIWHVGTRKHVEVAMRAHFHNKQVRRSTSRLNENDYCILHHKQGAKSFLEQTRKHLADSRASEVNAYEHTSARVASDDGANDEARGGEREAQ